LGVIKEYRAMNRPLKNPLGHERGVKGILVSQLKVTGSGNVTSDQAFTTSLILVR
jgi:hypothetical protein